MSSSRRGARQVQEAYWSEGRYARRDPDHPVVRAVFAPLARAVASQIEDPRSARVLDVGCGNGFLQRALERHIGSVIGVDYSRPMLEVNPCATTILGSCTELPFADRSFDVVVAANLLHHVPAPERVRTVREMHRVARSSVVSFEPNRNNPFMFAFALVKPAERMTLSFGRSYMRTLFEKAGLTDPRVRVEGWIVPNRAPTWWIPVGRALDHTPLRRVGFYVRSIGAVEGPEPP